MKKHNIIESIYIKPFGYSSVTIGTELGVFEGESMYNNDNDDKEKYCSEMFGGRLAELRALEKYYKRKLLLQNARVAMAKETYNSAPQTDKRYLRYLEKKMNAEIEKAMSAKEGVKAIQRTIASYSNEYAEEHIKSVDKLHNRKTPAERLADFIGKGTKNETHR